MSEPEATPPWPRPARNGGAAKVSRVRRASVETMNKPRRLIHSFDCFAPADPFLAPPLRGGGEGKKEVAGSAINSLVYTEICPTNGGKLR